MWGYLVRTSILGTIIGLFRRCGYEYERTFNNVSAGAFTASFVADGSLLGETRTKRYIARLRIVYDGDELKFSVTESKTTQSLGQSLKQRGQKLTTEFVFHRFYTPVEEYDRAASQTVFDSTVQKIPMQFVGNNMKLVFESLKDKIPPKDEFEKTNDYYHRINFAVAQKIGLKGKCDDNSSFVAVIAKGPNFYYDADREQMRVSVVPRWSSSGFLMQKPARFTRS